METHPSFMLLPDFSFSPNKEIRLGTLLTGGKSKNYPDPRRPVNSSTRVEVSFKDCTIKLGLAADVSVIPVAGGSFGGGSGKDCGLEIYCEKLTIEWFAPTKEYFELSLNPDVIKSYASGFGRPALFMVTGLMTASDTSNASVHWLGRKSRSREASLAADGALAGFPGNFGPELESTRSLTRQSASIPREPFIVAYQLRRIQLKKDGSFTERDENKWALFSEDDPVDEEAGKEGFEKWEIEAVTDELDLQT